MDVKAFNRTRQDMVVVVVTIRSNPSMVTEAVWPMAQNPLHRLRRAAMTTIPMVVNHPMRYEVYKHRLGVKILHGAPG